LTPSSFEKISPRLSTQFAASTNRRLQFQKRSWLLIRTHNETLPVAAMRVNNPDRSPVGINRRDTAQTPPDFPEIVRDDLPLLRACSAL
jgi:hypothetical protein